jgi:hypothetical protein
LLARSAAPLIARNAGHRLELLERCGATLTAEQAGKLIDKRRRSGTLIGVRQGGSWHYPGCQFGEQRHEVIAGLPRLLEAMPKSSPRVVLDFLLAPDQTLNGRTPLEVLRAEGWTGDLDRLVRIEHGDGFAWAARRRCRYRETPSGAAPLPPAWLASANLPIQAVPAGTRLYRVQRLTRDRVFFGPGAAVMQEWLRDAGAVPYANGMSGAGPLKIILSVHSAEAIALRGIDLAWVEATIVAPDWTEPDSRPGRTRSFKAIAAFGSRVLRVVDRPADDGVMVITTFFDRGAKR